MMEKYYCFHCGAENPRVRRTFSMEVIAVGNIEIYTDKNGDLSYDQMDYDIDEYCQETDSMNYECLECNTTRDWLDNLVYVEEEHSDMDCAKEIIFVDPNQMKLFDIS